jgi:hypothetical protein
MAPQADNKLPLGRSTLFGDCELRVSYSNKSFLGVFAL